MDNDVHYTTSWPLLEIQRGNCTTLITARSFPTRLGKHLRLKYKHTIKLLPPIDVISLFGSVAANVIPMAVRSFAAIANESPAGMGTFQLMDAGAMYRVCSCITLSAWKEVTRSSRFDLHEFTCLEKLVLQCEAGAQPILITVERDDSITAA